ncbi:hypothetical protein CHU98_g8075 [Xylaria longipes]|nr:hypothetical protein CHU98_g8075 [Xylaria longipes]
MPPAYPTPNTDTGVFDVGVPYPLSGAVNANWNSTTTQVVAGVFFGISAALLVIALPLVLCNYCRARRQSAREGRFEI